MNSASPPCRLMGSPVKSQTLNRKPKVLEGLLLHLLRCRLNPRRAQPLGQFGVELGQYAQTDLLAQQLHFVHVARQPLLLLRLFVVEVHVAGFDVGQHKAGFTGVGLEVGHEFAQNPSLALSLLKLDRLFRLEFLDLLLLFLLCCLVCLLALAGLLRFLGL